MRTANASLSRGTANAIETNRGAGACAADPPSCGGVRQPRPPPLAAHGPAGAARRLLRPRGRFAPCSCCMPALPLLCQQPSKACLPQCIWLAQRGTHACQPDPRCRPPAQRARSPSPRSCLQTARASSRARSLCFVRGGSPSRPALGQVPFPLDRAAQERAGPEKQRGQAASPPLCAQSTTKHCMLSCCSQSTAAFVRFGF